MLLLFACQRLKRSVEIRNQVNNSNKRTCDISTIKKKMYKRFLSENVLKKSAQKVTNDNNNNNNQRIPYVLALRERFRIRYYCTYSYSHSCYC